VTVNAADLELLPSAAVSVTVVFALTVVVFTVKVIEVFPAGIVTDAGTVADGELLESEIIRPPVGAAVPIATVPILVFPPFTEVGFKVRDLIVGELTVNVAV